MHILCYKTSRKILKWAQNWAALIPYWARAALKIFLLSASASKFSQLNKALRNIKDWNELLHKLLVFNHSWMLLSACKELCSVSSWLKKGRCVTLSLLTFLFYFTKIPTDGIAYYEIKQKSRFFWKDRFEMKSRNLISKRCNFMSWSLRLWSFVEHLMAYGIFSQVSLSYRSAELSMCARALALDSSSSL